MEAKTLGEAEKKAALVSILVVMLVLMLFVSVMVVGQPISYLGSEPTSVAYALLVYLPVILLCLTAFRRIRR
jgi:hypothetical protein